MRSLCQLLCGHVQRYLDDLVHIVVLVSTQTASEHHVAFLLGEFNVLLIQGAVAIVTIDRPKALNALNPEVLADLKAAFEAIDQNTVRCVVLTGAGDKSFVAGADIGEMSTLTKAEGEAFGKTGNDVCLLYTSPSPRD